MLSWKSPIPSPTPNPAPQPTHSCFLALAFHCTGAYDHCKTPRASPPIDGQLGHPLLHMQLETWVPPCVFFDWWFSPRELWAYWLVHIVAPPLGLQTPSVPWVLSQTPLMGTLCSVQWIAVSIHFCICQALAEPLRRQLYQASVSKLLLASTVVSGFDGCLWDGSPGGPTSRTYMIFTHW